MDERKGDKDGEKDCSPLTAQRAWQMRMQGWTKNICWMCNGNDRATSGESCVLQQKKKRKKETRLLQEQSEEFTASVVSFFVFTKMSFGVSTFVRDWSSLTKCCPQQFYLCSVHSRWREWLSSVTFDFSIGEPQHGYATWRMTQLTLTWKPVTLQSAEEIS